MGNPKGSATTGQVQSLVRALGILETLASHRNGLRLTELANKIKLPRSTTHRLLTTMDGLHFVLFDTATNHWLIGPQALTVGAAFGGVHDIARLGQPFIRSLNEASQEMVSLVLPDEQDIICVEQKKARLATTRNFRVGDRRPMHLTAAGCSILAWWNDDSLGAYFNKIAMRGLTEKSITDTNMLTEKLHRSKKRGYAMDQEESVKELCCVGAPVFNSRAEPVAALSISAPRARMPRSRMHSLGQELQATACNLTNTIGGQLPEEIHR